MMKNGFFSFKPLLVSFLLLQISYPAFGQGPAGDTGKTTRFSILVNNKEGAYFKPDWLVLKEVERRKNVMFDVKTVPDAAYGQAIDATFASAGIPDIILKIYPDQAARYAASGLLLPVSDYAYLMPNFTRYVRENNLNGELDKLRDKNGKFYVFPGFQREIQVQQWIYRKDAFDKFGLAAPATYDDLFRALVILKQKYPESLPLSACWAGAHLFAMMGAGYGIQAGWNGDRMYDPKVDAWFYSPGTGNWKEMVRFLAKCYKAGLLDPEIFTQDPAAYNRKLVDGRTFVTVSWISSGFSAWDKQLAANGVPGGTWVPLKVPESTVGIRALPAVNRFRKGAAVPVRVLREPYFRKLIELLDWIFYSEEGRTLAVWGVEGTTFSVSKGGKEYLPAIASFSNPDGVFNPAKEYGLNVLFDLAEVPDYEDAKKPADIVKFLDETLKGKLTARMDPPLPLSDDDVDTIGILGKGLSAYMNDSMKGFITGAIDIETGWKSYKETLAFKGSVQLETILNNAWRKTGKK